MAKIQSNDRFGFKTGKVVSLLQLLQTLHYNFMFLSFFGGKVTGGGNLFI